MILSRWISRNPVVPFTLLALMPTLASAWAGEEEESES